MTPADAESLTILTVLYCTVLCSTLNMQIGKVSSISGSRSLVGAVTCGWAPTSMYLTVKQFYILGLFSMFITPGGVNGNLH